ncbi:MAG: right-handed parallel beta-helix repeat-containing protein [Planctomycetota bacterium]|nr:right-handed parallel beta-helix repeat-containing protein [Planctomycetota bacterium]
MMPTISRRNVLAGVGAGFLAGVTRSRAMAPPVQVGAFRAVDGDERAKIDWAKKLTITVGQKKGDIVGQDDKAIQAAVDYVARLGSGTVQVGPGIYRLRNSIYLPSGIRLAGHGVESVLTKIASNQVELSADSDWYDQEITLAEAADFRVGDGVTLIGNNPHDGGSQVLKRTLVARSGNRYKLNQGLRKNLWISQKPTCASLFPLLTSENCSDVVIENLCLDGNRANNSNLNGNYGGNIFLQDCNRFTIRNVEARNYNGDGISFQICHDIRVENCHVHGNQGNGLHPGSGAQRPIMRDNLLEDNNIGLFWCWGVKHGLAEKNRMMGNRSQGMSIGHNDTDNVMRDNEISRSGKVGILFRDDSRGQDFWANRNVLENNRIVDSGGDNGIAIDILGNTKDVLIAENTIHETRGPGKRLGIHIAKAVERLKLRDNVIEGFHQPISDDRQF